MFKAPARGIRRSGQARQVKERAERIPVTKSATISIDGADMQMPCTVRDISATGAKLTGPSISQVPDYFLMVTRSENLVARARVAWRRELEIGVQFIRKGDLSRETSLRREQAAAYAKEQAELQRRAQEAQAVQQQAYAQHQAYLQQAAALRGQQLTYFGLPANEPYTEDDLKSAYRKLAMQLHPDRGGTMEQFQNLNLIYNNLMAHLQQSEPQAQAIAV